MNFIFPILAAVLQAGSFTLDKVVLSIRRVSFKTYTGVSFPLVFLITLVIFFIFRPPLSFDLLAGNLWWLLALSIALTIIGNIVFYKALDADHLGEMQLIDLLRDVPIIIVSSIIFVDERNFYIIIPALVASAVAVWSHWNGNHFKIQKYTLIFFVASLILSPARAALSKLLLESWNPISLELVRSGAIALILGLLFFKSAKKISAKAFSILVVTNILTSIAWILYYFSYQRSGIIYTTLLFSLQPLLVYFASLFLLKERLQWKKAVAFVVILISIVVAQFISK